MLSVLGVFAGVALGLGVAGHKGQHWAVRVLCALVFALVMAALVGVWLVGGKGSPAGDMWAAMLLGFIPVVAVLGMIWIADYIRWLLQKRAAGAEVCDCDKLR